MHMYSSECGIFFVTEQTAAAHMVPETLTLHASYTTHICPLNSGSAPWQQPTDFFFNVFQGIVEPISLLDCCIPFTVPCLRATRLVRQNGKQDPQSAAARAVYYTLLQLSQ